MARVGDAGERTFPCRRSKKGHALNCSFCTRRASVLCTYVLSAEECVQQGRRLSGFAVNCDNRLCERCARIPQPGYAHCPDHPKEDPKK